MSKKERKKAKKKAEKKKKKSRKKSKKRKKKKKRRSRYDSSSDDSDSSSSESDSDTDSESDSSSTDSDSGSSSGVDIDELIKAQQQQRQNNNDNDDVKSEELPRLNEGGGDDNIYKNIDLSILNWKRIRLDSSTKSHKIKNLVHGWSYLVRIRGKNDSGWGQWSDPIKVSTKTIQLHWNQHKHGKGTTFSIHLSTNPVFYAFFMIKL